MVTQIDEMSTMCKLSTALLGPRAVPTPFVHFAEKKVPCAALPSCFRLLTSLFL